MNKLKNFSLQMMLVGFILLGSSCREENPCDYLDYFKDFGNRVYDTVAIKGRLVDPLDDTLKFKKAKFGFVLNNGEVYRKSRTHSRCEGKQIDVEYYQNLSDRIDLNSYKEFDEQFFATKNKVNFWWVNSDGHLIIPVNGADAETFQPFKGICGGTDKNSVYYGCPNYGVSRLNIPENAEFEFIPKDNNYWNAPQHYVLIDKKVYDIQFDIGKKEKYFCIPTNEITYEQAIKIKGN